MKTKSWLGAGLLFSICMTVHSQNAPPVVNELQQGKRTFDGSCGRCHGFDGSGGIGPNLQRSQLVRPENDQALKTLIQNGAVAKGMPPTPGLTDDELRMLTAYVHSLAGGAGRSLSAQAMRGRAVYNKLDCNSCHVIDGEGRSVGPELTNVGAKRKPADLIKDVTEPAASLPQGAGGVIQFLTVHVVTLQGREVEGTRINEDAFSIQLRDAGGRLHTFRKDEIKQLDKHYERSSMPSYKDRLGAGELDDLAAYLSSLGGSK